MTWFPRFAFWTVPRLAVALASMAGLAVLLTIGDPGMTVDEPLDVAPGRRYIEVLQARGFGFFEPKTVQRVFADNAEHPPLGRWLLGAASKLGEPIELIIRGRDPGGLYIRAGRAAPALCFAILVGLVTLEAGRRAGRSSGFAAGFSLLVMPRVFAHAHLGALDTFVALFWTLGLLSAVRAVESPRPVLRMTWAGVLWGLALLTKIHGWLLAPAVLAWTLAKLPWRKAIPALLVWGAIGLSVFFVGWPWLWYETWERLVQYLGRSVDRLPILVQYFGKTYKDFDLPWHYPWLYFAATVPLGLHVLGLWGAIRGRSDPFVRLMVGTILGWLTLFSVRVAVYDGDRLFLPAFPLWAILAGFGFVAIWKNLGRWRSLRAGLIVLLLLQAQGVWSIHPFGLSFYNGLVGGLSGAERMGLELTFWGDSVDSVLLDRLASEAEADDPAALAPTLAPSQGAVATTPALARLPVVLQDEQAVVNSEWVVVYRREAYWEPEIQALVQNPPILLRKRQGVWLSGLWRRPLGK